MSSDLVALVKEEALLSVCVGLAIKDESSQKVRLVHYNSQGYFEKCRLGGFSNADYTIGQTYSRYLLYGSLSAKAAVSRKPCKLGWTFSHVCSMLGLHRHTRHAIP